MMIDYTKTAAISGVGYDLALVEGFDKDAGVVQRHVVVTSFGPVGASAKGSIPCTIANCLKHDFQRSTDAIVFMWNTVVDDAVEELDGEGRIDWESAMS